MENLYKVFQVTTHLDNGKTEAYNCLAYSDYDARGMGIRAMKETYKEAGVSDIPEVDFCEIRMICYVDILPESMDVVKSEPIPE